MKTPELIDESPTTLREEELREMGFEEDDEPTQMLVDPRPLVKKPSTIVPPRIDEGDVYMLTEQHLRYKAGIVPMDDERVDLRDIMRAAPSLPPMSERVPEIGPAPEQVPVPRANSLSPVAMSNSDTTVPPVAMTRPRPHPAWPATLAVLSVAAVGVFFIRPPASASASSAAAIEQAPVVMAPAVEPPVAATATGSFELPAIEISASAATAVVPGPLPANVPTAVVEQPSAAVSPVPGETPAAETAAAAAELPPVEPPPPEAPPFDRSVASSALSVAAGSASSCREPGVPSSPVSVRVTFAPSGAVTIATVENAPYAGTAAGGCIARVFRSAKVPAFSGTSVTVHKTFQLD